jgi:hypothetical protein
MTERSKTSRGSNRRGGRGRGTGGNYQRASTHNQGHSQNQEVNKQIEKHSTKRLRILCLHGNRQCAEIFSQRLEKIIQRIQQNANSDTRPAFHFLDAPHELPLDEGQVVQALILSRLVILVLNELISCGYQQVAMRTWW